MTERQTEIVRAASPALARTHAEFINRVIALPDDHHAREQCDRTDRHPVHSRLKANGDGASLVRYCRGAGDRGARPVRRDAAWKRESDEIAAAVWENVVANGEPWASQDYLPDHAAPRAPPDHAASTSRTAASHVDAIFRVPTCASAVCHTLAMRSGSTVRWALAITFLACTIGGCTEDAGPESVPSSVGGDFCEIYGDDRDGPASDAAVFADRLEAMGPPDGLQDSARAGFGVYLAYLRDLGDGIDAPLYDDQYATVLGGATQTQFRAFIESVDRECGVAGNTSPTDANEEIYCEAFQTVFKAKRSNLLSKTGTPASLGVAPNISGDFSSEARRGFAAVASAMEDLSSGQAAVLDASGDEALRQIVGVTDAFFADTWFVASYGLCVGSD